MKQPSTILITGGHLTPALAFIDYCQELKLPYHFVFAGRQFAQKANVQLSLEKTEIKNRNLKFISFDSVKSNDFNLWSLCQSIKQARKILQENKVNLFLSFGGYLALPFAIAAYFLKIPVITHEQTQVLGKANRLIAPFATQIALSFPTTSTKYPQKTIVTGNPLRLALFQKSNHAPAWFTSKDSKKPLLYVSGGSQGSQKINQNIATILPKLLEKFVVIHQIGAASPKRDPAIEIETILQTLPKFDRKDYFQRAYLHMDELRYFYPRFHLAVSRAGANSVAELSAFNIPTLYIPLPFTNYNEQFANAHYLVKKHAALLLPQDNLSPETLYTNIMNLNKTRNDIVYNLQKNSVSRDGTCCLEKLIDKVLHDPKD